MKRLKTFRFIAAVLVLTMLIPGSSVAGSEKTQKLKNILIAAAATSGITLDGKNPFINSCLPVTTPTVSYYKVTGHFGEASNKFAFYFPSKKQWKGRFFQRVYPTEDEKATEDSIGFGAEKGAYTVKTNCSGGYMLNAAAASLSRKIAAAYYNIDDAKQHIYGYIYGGSGGSYQTIGAVENTTGVWDGAVPYITGLPTSIPNYFFIRAFARFFLEDKAEAIEKAMNPGGSGDPYSVLDSNLEKSVFQEVTDLGVPLRAWEDTKYVLSLNHGPDYLLGFGSTVRSIDPTYCDDFWNKEGYIGTEESDLGKSFRDAHVNQKATIVDVQFNNTTPVSVQLDYAPEDMTRTMFEFTLYQEDGTTTVGAITGTLDVKTKIFKLSTRNSPNILGALKKGAKINIDNSWSLALLVYHRYQVPSDNSYYAWSQFRDTEGKTKYPQRSNIGAMIANSVSGGAKYDGHFDGKMIMVSNLLDCDAYTWDGDWYSKKVKSYYGNEYNNKYRLWYNDNADHIEFGPRTQRLVQYDGIVERALVELSTWVEKGIEPAQSTNYELVGSQIQVPKTAEERLGVQPVVDLTVGNSKIVYVQKGESVTFKGEVQVPPNSGQIIETEWDFLGNGKFITADFGKPQDHIKLTKSYTFNTPGIYYPALRVTAEKTGNKNTHYANVENLDRICVVVSE